MVDVAPIGEKIETESDLGTGDPATYAYWMAQEAIAEKEEGTWQKRGADIVKRYRDERPDAEGGSHKMNILWSNVQTLKPALYARTPKPDVDRRFKDQDPVGRLAAQLLQRCLAYSAAAFDFDGVMKAVVEDRLLPGRGIARVLYVPHYGEEIPPEKVQGETDGGEGAPSAADNPAQAEQEDRENFAGEQRAGADVGGLGDEGQAGAAAPEKRKPERKVVYEEVVGKYVFWRDYREGPARQWPEVPWLRYRAYMTREELIDRFGKAKGSKVNLDVVPDGLPARTGSDGKAMQPPDIYKKAEVLEFWDKVNRKVVWIAPATTDVVLDELDDPLGLPDFFPNPDPLFATTTNDKRIPVPDYAEYQDQAKELDTLTAKIDRLTRALKVAGVYPGEEKAVLQQLIDEGTENRLIPVHDWQNWSDKGGLESFIQWMPIKQIAETLIALHQSRDKVKALLYELTGIGDIMRGMTEPEETLGAQELKAVFSTRRVTPQQKDVARFARDLLRLMGGVIAEHFSGKTISLITGFPQLAPVPQIGPAPQAPPQIVMEIAQHQAMMQAQPPQGAPPATAVQPAPAPQGPPGGPPGAPPAGLQPAPLSPQAQQFIQTMMAWQQQSKQVQAIQQANAQKQQQFDAAVALIKQDGVHGFRIDIEADSTIAPDEQAEKKARTEFLAEFIPLMQQVVPLAMGNPPLAALAKEVALFGVRGFPVARSLEETIEKTFDAIAQMPPHPSQQPQSKDSPDSPAALALRGKDIDSRVAIANQNNAVKMTDIAARERTEALRVAASQQQHRESLALETEHSARQQALSAVRMTHLESRDAGTLT